MTRRTPVILVVCVSLIVGATAGLVLAEVAAVGRTAIVVDPVKFITKDLLDFIAKSEWPIVVMVAGLTFRHQVIAVFDGMRVKRIKGPGGFDFEMESLIEKAEVLSKGVEAATPVDQVQSSPDEKAAVATAVAPELSPPSPTPSGAKAHAQPMEKPRPGSQVYWSVQPKRVRDPGPYARIRDAAAAMDLNGQTTSGLILEAWGVLERDMRELSIYKVGRYYLQDVRKVDIPLTDDERSALDALELVRNRVAHTDAELDGEEAARFLASAQRMHNRLVELINQ